MKKLTIISGFLLLIICTLLFPTNANVEASGKVSDGSGVANITLEGLTHEEATEILVEHTTAWKNEEPIKAESEYETLFIPREVFVFDIDASLHNLTERTKRHWSNFFIKEKNVQVPLEVTLDLNYEEILNWSLDIDTEATLHKALSFASNLLESDILIEYEESATFERIKIAETAVTLPNASEPIIIRLAEELNEQVISADETFSFLGEVTLPNGMDQSSIEKSFVASALYYLTLYTDLEIIERHASETQPTFTEAGLEAMIDREAERNLLIHNAAPIAYSVEAQVVEEELYMAIYTTKHEKPYDYVIENKKEIEPRTIYRYSDKLTGDEKEMLTEGTPGLQLELHRNRFSNSGVLEETELLARDFYPPEHKVVLVAKPSDQQEIEEELETETETEAKTDDSNSFFINPIQSVQERADLIATCEGDLDCEAAYEISPMEEMIATCLVDLVDKESKAEVREDETNETTTNPFCDFVNVLLFLSLFSDEGLEEEWFDSDLINQEEATEEVE